MRYGSGLVCLRFGAEDAYFHPIINPIRGLYRAHTKIYGTTPYGVSVLSVVGCSWGRILLGNSRNIGILYF